MAVGNLAEQLQKQNNTLVKLNDNISSLSGSVATMVMMQNAENLRRREAEDDARKAALAASNAASGGAGGGGAGGAGGSGMFAGLGTLGVAGATGGILKTMGMIAKRGLLAGAMNAAAGVTADFVETQTGSVELGDATMRAMKLGSFGLLFGKKFGLMAGFAGALATDENIAKLQELGDNLGPLKDVAIEAFNKLPSMNEVLQKATSAFGDTLDMINSALEGDLAGMADASYGTAVVAAGLGNKRNAQGLKNLAGAAKDKITGPKMVGGEFSKADRLKFNSETVKGLSNRKIKALEKQGLTVDKSTGSVSRNGKFVSADDMDDAFKKAGVKTSGQSKGAKAAAAELNGKAASKFGRFGKLLSFGKRIPILGTLLTSGMMASTLMNDELSQEEKSMELAKQFGGIGGAALGGILGGMAGTVVPGVGNIVGGLIGAFGGAVAGEKLAYEAAQYLLGGDSGTLEAAALSDGITLPNDAGGTAGTSGASSGGTASAAIPTSGARVTAAAGTAASLGNSSPVVIMDNSSNNTNVSGGGGGGMSFGSTDWYDSFDPFLGTRTAG
jgi:hypothetical protein